MFGSRAQGLREELLGKKSQLHGHDAKHFTGPPYQVRIRRILRFAQRMQLISLFGGYK